ncbi:Uncharacterised protein [Mycolicibacterium vanbaalenii]|uniref:Uncharacterized protein n=1 Tax=Mycolicibacterium vanbaalenii TaxID=110539 RepID=A0A5S9MR99_MYCVN|nr:Uncharacterised protein [Mycolicibacterium vanbaalenii]
MTRLCGSILIGALAGLVIAAASGYLLLMYGPDLPAGFC